MNDSDIVGALKGFVNRAYPDMLVEIKPVGDGSGKRGIYLIEERFRGLYQLQRHHRILHLIPEEFSVAHLSDFSWYECVPGEDPADLLLPDEDLLEDITPDVLQVLRASGFFEKLDATMCATADHLGSPGCDGDFAVSKRILADCNRPEDEFFDIFHVLMNRGAYCDCEILYNVAEDSTLKRRYWEQRGLTSGCTRRRARGPGY